MSDASLITALTSRIEDLERQTARLRRLFFCSLIALLCAGTAATTVAAQRSISFKDAAGNVISLDSAGFHLVDAAGRQRIKMGFNSAHGPALSFYDADKVERMQLHVSSGGTPAIVLLDPQGAARMFVGLTPDSPTQPRIEFRDKNRTQRLYVGLGDKESGMVSMFDAHERKMADLQETYLRMHDSSATERLYIGLSPEERPFLEMFDSGHTERSYFGTYTDGGFGASVYDTDGGVSWRVP